MLKKQYETCYSLIAKNVMSKKGDLPWVSGGSKPLSDM